ncbi:hypothetical protein Bbelb_182200 [Branchiostoma belcheri]|nr:hypothetical protein Bbelb_182200 [Branchiostoma belcheri]
MATAGDYILIVVIGIIIVVTVIGGLLTIVAIWTRPTLRKPINIPLASLSCTVIIFAILYCSFWIQHILYPEWEPPATLCWILGYATPVLWGVSVCHILCIALQHYFKVCANSARLTSTPALVVMLSLAWLVPITSFLPLYASEEVKLDPKLKRCSMGSSDKVWAKIFPAIFAFLGPYVATLIFYSLIRNHVRKSKKRIQANRMQDPNPNRLSVKYSSEKGNDAGPSTSRETYTKSSIEKKGMAWEGGKRYTSRDEEQKGCKYSVVWEGGENSTSSGEEQERNGCSVREGDENSTTRIDEGKKGNDVVVWEGGENSTSSGEEEKHRKCSVVWEGSENSASSGDELKGNDFIGAGKQEGAVLAIIPDAIKQQRHVGLGQNYSEEIKANDKIEPGEPKTIAITVTTVSADRNKLQHDVPGNSSQNKSNINNAADRMITKMMMALFVAFTVCCMPVILMAFAADKVPAEAFTVGQLLAALNGALNPIIYGVMNKNIRQGYKHIWDNVLNYIT